MESKQKTVYQVRNCYWLEQDGPRNHRTPNAAYRAVQKREGDGWGVYAIDGDSVREVIEHEGHFYVTDDDGDLEEI